MPRRPRQDGPDTWHHVMNRGIARRPIFETDRDRRFFLALLAREVRAGRIEVHAFCLMLTHFHLLLRSVTGELSKALQRITNRYARWFNRTRRRDGPLFRGRFLSRHVDRLAYRRAVVRYIHDNPVAAALVSDPVTYEWLSAMFLAADKRPRWLATGWVDDEIARRGRGASRAERLETAFPCRLSLDFRGWVEKQLHARPLQDLEDVSLKHAGSPRVVRWAMRKTKLADGSKPFRPVCRPHLVDRVLRLARATAKPLLGYFKSPWKDAWVVLRAALLRLLAGCTHREIGHRVGRHAATISRDVRDHGRLLDSAPEYAELTSQVAHAALAVAR